MILLILAGPLSDDVVMVPLPASAVRDLAPIPFGQAVAMEFTDEAACGDFLARLPDAPSRCGALGSPQAVARDPGDRHAGAEKDETCRRRFFSIACRAAADLGRELGARDPLALWHGGRVWLRRRATGGDTLRGGG
ncbi:MAG: hypothetical protein ACKO4T_14595 [Planctomycetaceae bacterium]